MYAACLGAYKPPCLVSLTFLCGWVSELGGNRNSAGVVLCSMWGQKLQTAHVCVACIFLGVWWVGAIAVLRTGSSSHFCTESCMHDRQGHPTPWWALHTQHGSVTHLRLKTANSAVCEAMWAGAVVALVPGHSGGGGEGFILSCCWDL